MFNIAEIYTIPKIGTLAACYSDKWDNMSREEIKDDIKDLHDITVEGVEIHILDYSVDMPFSGGKSVTFKIEDNDRLSGIAFPVSVDY